MQEARIRTCSILADMAAPQPGPEEPSELVMGLMQAQYLELPDAEQLKGLPVATASGGIMPLGERSCALIPFHTSFLKHCR